MHIIEVTVEPIRLLFDDVSYALIRNQTRLISIKMHNNYVKKVKNYLGCTNLKEHLDHLNHNPYDYRMDNLELKSAKANMHNRRPKGEIQANDHYGANIHYRHIREAEEREGHLSNPDTPSG